MSVLRALARALLVGVASALTAGLPAFAALAPAGAQALATAPGEYEIKAVFLFNFAQFVEWPAAAFQDPAAPLVIGILGTDPFGNYLDEVVRGEAVKGRSLVVKRFRRVEDVDVCHILFVSPSDGPSSGAAALAGRAILTVSDAQRGDAAGAMIQFVDVQKHVRLRIDVDTAGAAGLTISSKLLRSAEIVRPKRG